MTCLTKPFTRRYHVWAYHCSAPNAEPILEHFNIFLSFLATLSFQILLEKDVLRPAFLPMTPNLHCIMHSCHNGEKPSGAWLTDQPSLLPCHPIYFICMKPETSPKKARRFFLNFCLFGRSSELERLFELVRLWNAIASLDFTVGFCCFSSNSWTSLCRDRMWPYSKIKKLRLSFVLDLITINLLQNEKDAIVCIQHLVFLLLIFIYPFLEGLLLLWD